MSKRKLLLADDSITIQKVVNLTFADEGIEVFTVGDGDSAMEKLIEISPDLVMADVNMPGLNGYQICEKIRQSDTLRQTPVILLVGSFEPFDEEEAKRVGADDFLTKPFQSIRQLVNKVTVLLNSSDREPTDDLTQAVAANSFAETLEMPKPGSAGTTEFSHTEFDDEMIQTDQVGSFALDESHKFETHSDAGEEDYAKTQPLSSEDVKDFAFSRELQETAVSEEASTIETPEESSVSEEASAEEDAPAGKEISYNEISYNEPAEVSETAFVNETVPAVAEESAESFVTTKYSADEIAEDYSTGELSSESNEENISQEYEAHDEAPESYTTDESPADMYKPFTEEATAPLETVDPDEKASAFIEAKTEELPLPSSASILDVDEDILELPPIEGESAEEDEEEHFAQTNVQSEDMGDSSSVHESIEESETPAKPETSLEGPVAAIEEPVAAVEEPAAPVATASAGTLQLSPESIDAIAQRVIEKLSEKAIKDIAWEVVPQMTELIVKQIAEEKLKE